jgi:hypothetical protein
MRPKAANDLVVMWDDGPEDSLALLQHGLQRALVAHGVPPVHRARSSLTRMIARAVGKTGLVRAVLPRGSRRSLTVLSWASDARTFPDSYWRQPVPWIFDCWEPQFPQWERLLRRHKISIAFFSSRSTTKYFASRIQGLQAHWIPEACDPERFEWERPLANRSCGVLELGRKWTALHERIREPLRSAGIRHLYSDPRGSRALFPHVGDLRRGLGETAIMLCFPRSITHPESAGCVETFTQRYLEAIGSGCLVVGRAPAELVELFGFDPMIRLDDSDPGAHLLRILADLPSYQWMVDKARLRLLEVGTFEVRARDMLEVLDWYDGTGNARRATTP